MVLIHQLLNELSRKITTAPHRTAEGLDFPLEPERLDHIQQQVSRFTERLIQVASPSLWNYGQGHLSGVEAGSFVVNRSPRLHPQVIYQGEAPRNLQPVSLLLEWDNVLSQPLV